MTGTTCSKCLLHSRLPGVRIESNGACNFCNTGTLPKLKPREELDRIIAEARGRNPQREYDCILGLSGGRDSTWMTKIATKDLGLKILAFNNDHGFTPEHTRRNIERIVKYAGVDFIQYRTPKNLAVRTTRLLCKTLIPFGPGAMMRELCAPCQQAAAAAALKIALEKRIPLGLDGRSEGEQVVFDADTSTRITRWKALFSSSCLLYLRSLWGKYRISRNLRIPGRLSRNRITYLAQLEGRQDTNLIKLFDYIPWDRREMKRFLLDELGWEKPADSPTTWRTDCIVIPLVNYLWQVYFGITKLEEGFAHMIRIGQMERAEALEQVRQARLGRWTEEIDEICRRTLGLSRRDAAIVRSWQEK